MKYHNISEDFTGPLECNHSGRPKILHDRANHTLTVILNNFVGHILKVA